MRNFLAIFGVLVLCVTCLAQSNSNVQVSLSLADEKAVYRVGEPILLRLKFSGSVTTSLNITTTDPASPIDRLVVSPMNGVFPWLDDQDLGHPYVPDFMAIEKVGPGKSQIVELPLNAVYRFDNPGQYSVYVVTRRTQSDPPGSPDPPGGLTTNTITFDIEPMTDEEEATRASELEQRIRQAGKLASARKYAEELDWLSGDPSTRVKVSLLLHPKEFYPFAVDVTEGLWIARNRTLVVDRLEKALRDPTQPVGSTLLQTAITLRARLDDSANPNGTADSLRRAEIEAGYLKQIAASLPERRGNSLVTAAQTVFARLLARHDVSSSEFAAARELVLTHFAEMDKYNVDSLLNSYGTYLQDQRLTPVLKQILATQRDPIMRSERTAAIRQLIRIAPQETRVEIADEVCGDNPTFAEIFGEVPFQTLPETDGCLQQKVRLALDTKKRPPLEWAAASIARFASAAIYDDLFALCQQGGAAWDKQAEGSLLAYLVRWNPTRGLPLLEAALPRDTVSPNTSITFGLGRAGYIPALDVFWRERLAGSPPEMAAEAAHQLSATGPSEVQFLLRARLSDWRDHWKGREIPLSEGRFEADLTQALMSGANWRLSKDAIQSLVSGCLSDICRTRFGANAVR